MRKLLRILLLCTVAGLLVCIATLLLGDRLVQRTVPAVRIVYEVDGTGGGGRLGDAQVDEMASALQRRLDRQQMNEVQVRRSGPAKIEVLAPASVPKGDLKRVLAIGGMLSCHVVVEDPNEPGVAAMLPRMEPGGAGPKQQSGDTFRWFPCAQIDVSPVQVTSAGINYILVYADGDRAMTHSDVSRPWYVKNARATRDQNGGSAVAFELDRTGAERFGELTGSNIGRKLAIVLDGNVLSAPRVNSRIGANGIISGGPGGFTQQETDYLVSTLNAGSLPAKLSADPVSEEYLTMTLGLAPGTRFLLKPVAVSLAALACMLLLAQIILRRLRPTAAEEMDRLLSDESHEAK